MSKRHLNRILAVVLTLAMVLSVGFVLPVAADAPIELGYLHASDGTTQTSGGEIALYCDNNITQNWQNMYAESADCVQLIKSGNDTVYNIGALTEYGTSDGILVSHSNNELILRNSQWNLNCAAQSGTSPLAYGDTIIVGGNFTANGVVFHISTTYITKDADGYIHCSDTFEAGTFTPSATTDGFFLDAEYKCYTETWANFYADAASNVKLFRNGNVYNIGALTEYGTTDAILVSRNGNRIFFRNTQWNLNCTGISGLSPMTAGDVIYIGGTFTTNNGQTFHIKPTYMYMDSQGNLTTSDAYNVGTLSADSTHPAMTNDGSIYGIAEGGYNAGNWTEYYAESMDCVKLRKSGSNTDVPIGIPGSQNIMRKRGDNVFCVISSQYYLNLAGQSGLTPFEEGDVMIVEGNFTGVSDGITAHIEKTYITIENGNLVFSTTDPDDVPCAHASTTLTDAVAATCTTDGYTGDYVCDDCGAIVTAGSVIPATGHTWVTGATVLPTCTTAGYTTQTCSVCNATQQINPVAATGHTLVYTDNGDGTHDATCSVCNTLVVDDESCTYSNGVCTLCGAEEPAAGPEVDPTLAFYSYSLSLQDSLTFNFVTRNKALSAFDSIYVEFGCNDVKTGSYVTSEQVPAVYTSSYKMVTYSVFSMQMTDEITAVIHGFKGETEYVGEPLVISVESYALDKLPTATEAMKSVYANMLAYGTAAQINFSYNTDKLANENIGTYASYVTSGAPVVVDQSASTGTAGTVNLANTALGIEDAVKPQFGIQLPKNSDKANYYAMITYTDATGTPVSTRVDGADFTDVTTRVKAIYVNGLRATEGKIPVNLTVYDASTDAAVSQTFTYSIQSRIYAAQNNANTPVAQMNLLNALMNYYNAVEAAYAT